MGAGRWDVGPDPRAPVLNSSDTCAVGFIHVDGDTAEYLTFGFGHELVARPDDLVHRPDTPDPDAVGRPVEAQENLLHDGIGRPEPSSSRLPQQETRWSLVMPKVWSLPALTAVNRSGSDTAFGCSTHSGKGCEQVSLSSSAAPAAPDVLSPQQ